MKQQKNAAALYWRASAGQADNKFMIEVSFQFVFTSDNYVNRSGVNKKWSETISRLSLEDKQVILQTGLYNK